MLKITSLPQETQDVLNEITSKEPRDLTPYDIGFLKARRSYLRPEQVSVFKEVLEAKKPVETKKVEKTKVEDDPFGK